MIRILATAGAGIAAAHRAHVLHRDLKPANILITARGGNPYFAKVIDWGISKLEGPGHDLTSTGMLLGTLAYMAPEQLLDSRRTDERSDVFALGVIFYRMLTGGWFPHQHTQRLDDYEHLSAAGLHERQRTTPPVDPRTRLADVPPALANAIASNSGGGIALKSGSLTIQQSTLTQNTGPAITATGGQLAVFRSKLTHNTGGGVSINTAKFDLENNFITNNSGAAGLQVISIPSGQQPARFVFNTLMSNSVTSGAAGIDCTANSTILAFGDNIVYGNLTGGSATTQVAGGSCSYSFSDIGPGSVMSGTGNLAADPLVVNLGQEDDHISPGSPCRDAADQAATEMVDVDGDLRPQGARSDVGADEYKP